MYYNGELINEIKKNQTGTGLLIENDGHLSANADLIQQIKEDIHNGHKYICPEKVVLQGVFQKYGIVNANGRIYPKEALVPAVDQYIKERVANHNAIGALNHPSCVFGNTPILTENGWKEIKDVEEGENILTLNPETKKIEIKPVKRKIVSEYDGDMIRLKARFINIAVTPNHKFPIFGRDKKYKGLYTADEMYNHLVPDQGHSCLWRLGGWEGGHDEYFEIEALTDDELRTYTKKTLREKYGQPLQVPMDVWMKFMGIYLSEGNTNHNRVFITQKKQEVCNAIAEMLDEFPLDYKVYQRSNGCKCFNITDARLAKYLHQFGICYDKFVPYSIKKQSKEMLRIFYDWFVMGDGRIRGMGQYLSDDVFSTSKQLVMDLNEIQLKIGYCGVYHEEDRHIDRYIEGNRLIKAENSHNMHLTFRSLNSSVILNEHKSFRLKKEHYKGLVYCVEVDNHCFYVMDESGHCIWTGNSSELSGHDVAHNIIELHWEGSTLVGQTELHLSPGFIRYGVGSTSGDKVMMMLLDDILIGVSSRALGSVKQMPGGKLIVDNDVSIIAWDVVMEPSTGGAWLKFNKQELAPFIESEKKNGTPLDEKINSIHRILMG